jgi:hypothetical protein
MMSLIHSLDLLSELATTQRPPHLRKTINQLALRVHGVSFLPPFWFCKATKTNSLTGSKSTIFVQRWAKFTITSVYSNEFFPGKMWQPTP